MSKLIWSTVHHVDGKGELEERCGLCKHSFREGEPHWFPGPEGKDLAALLVRGILPVAVWDFCETCKERIEELLDGE